MDGKAGRFSISSDNKIKLEYDHNGRNRAALWEPFRGGIIETIYNEYGAVLGQRMFKNDGKKFLNERIDSVMKDASITSTSECKYTEIRLERRCPGCGAASLERVSDFGKEKPDLPVMPTYECRECKGKGYHLTDEYLEQMLAEQESLFSSKELQEMKTDRGAFKAQLNEYIIRIFASKRIMHIE